MIFLSPIIAFAVTTVLIFLILKSDFRKLVQDIPNPRSLHSHVVPRTGGIALLIGILSGWSMMSVFPWWIIFPLVVVFAVSVFDDIFSLPVKQRLPVHFFAAVLFIVGAGVIEQYGWVLALVLFFTIVWVTNLYNFMDGSDGLAGGMAVFGFGGYGVAAWLMHDQTFAIANVTILGAALGFLLFNFHPAKIFMGDAGSIPLGYLVVTMGIWGYQRGDWAVWFPVLVFSPFIVDATVTLVKRSLRGVRITEAHREHYYQRAIQMGVGHRNVALTEYSFMFGAAITAVCFREQLFAAGLWFAWVLIYAVCMFLIDIRWKRWDQKSS